MMNKRHALGVLKKVQGLGFHGWVEESRATGRTHYAVHVSAEHGDDAADYYGEYRGGYPWINPALEAIAKARDSYWEWDNPGSIAMWD